MIQAHIFYSGTVQGVGFRYTVQRLALDLKLNGWVRNLRDGRVEIVAEGEKESIERLMEKVDQHFEGYIRSKDIGFKAAENQFKRFQIAF